MATYNTQNFTGYNPNMPYNPAYGGTVVPSSGTVQTYGTFQPAQPVQVQQPQPSNSILTVFVNSEEEVNLYPVAAGVTVMLICFRLGKFYLKSTSKTGVPEQLRVFEFTEITQTIPENQNAGNFATKDEMKSLSDKLDKLIASLGGDK